MQLPDNYNKLTPMEKTDALGKSGAPQHQVSEFLDNGDKPNILRSVQASLRLVASGINNYLRFCTLTHSTDSRPRRGPSAGGAQPSTPAKPTGSISITSEKRQSSRAKTMLGLPLRSALAPKGYETPKP